MICQKVQNQLLTNNHLNLNKVYDTLAYILEHRLDYADLYFQSRIYESWLLENKNIKDGSYHINQGIGVRAVRGEKTGFAYADQITEKNLHESAKAARNIVTTSHKKIIDPLFKINSRAIYPTINPLNSMLNDDKIALLHHINTLARSIHPYVQQVNANLVGVYEEVLIAASDGTLATDIRPLVRLSITVQVENNGKRELGFSGGGARDGYHFFLNHENNTHGTRVDMWVHEAVNMALMNLNAIPSPSGMMTVVLGAGWPGILIHEAVGHGLEGDFNRKATSLFTKKIGKLVASELCTIIDDGTLKGMCGSLRVDDEGVVTQKNILIENGILKKYMQDKLNARLMGSQPTGNGRRESYAHLPMPRMTNTYMLPGKSSAEEIIQSVKYGLYATNFGGGQVDITSGNFVFSMSSAYLIKNGKITKPIKGATLIGSGIEVMQKISMIGDHLMLDKGLGLCGKDGQNIPVGVGQPMVKLDKITVGGTG